MTKAQTSAVSFAHMSSECAKGCLAFLGATKQAEEAMVNVNLLVAKMTEGKVTIGRLGKNPCPNALAFHSTLTDGGIAKGTANN